MQKSALFSRRPGATVDFRPDVTDGSPYAQLRRLSAYIKSDIALAADIEDCPEALEYAREYAYRKIFTGTSHEDFIKTNQANPDAVDWLIAVHEVEAAAHLEKRTRT